MRNRIFNLANGLTLSRFAAAPVILWLVLAMARDQATVSLAALGVMIATILTDLFDGMAARAYKMVTNFGKIMDPVADSTFFMTLLFAFSASPRFRENFPVWFPVIVLWREIAMHVLRRYSALKGIVLAAKASGKAKMFVQSIVMSALLALIAASDAKFYPLAEEVLQKAAFWSGVVVVAVNLLSLPEYLRSVPELIAEYASDTPTEKPE